MNKKKDTLVIPIGGKKIKATLRAIDLDKLRYDEFNPRISLTRDTHMGAFYKDKFPQEHIELVLKGTTSYQDLKISMMKGGGAMNPLWVYSEKDHFVVIEGNTRLAAYREIKKEESLEDFKQVNCYVLPKVEEEIKNFIRLTAHLHGQQDWDKYEQAKYLYVLSEKQHYPTSMLSNMTKLGRSDIDQDIEAYKIMTEQFYPKYGKYDKSFVHKFSYFKEYVKDKKLRTLMETLKMNSKDFCEWVGKGKFIKAQDVRKLRDLLENKKARELFIKKDLELATQELSNIQPEKTNKLFKLIKDLEDYSKNLKVIEIEEINSDNNKRKKIIQFLKGFKKTLNV